MSRWQNSSLRLQARRARMRSAQRCKKQIETPSSQAINSLVSSNLRVKFVPIAENIRSVGGASDSPSRETGKQWLYSRKFEVS